MGQLKTKAERTFLLATLILWCQTLPIPPTITRRTRAMAEHRHAKVPFFFARPGKQGPKRTPKQRPKSQMVQMSADPHSQRDEKDIPALTRDLRARKRVDWLCSRGANRASGR